MIANVVSGKVDPNSDEGVVRERLIPVLQQAQGYQGGYWLRQPGGDEVLAVTLWESESALRAALDTPSVQEVTAQTSAMFIGAPQMTVYRMIAQG